MRWPSRLIEVTEGGHRKRGNRDWPLAFQSWALPATSPEGNRSLKTNSRRLPSELSLTSWTVLLVRMGGETVLELAASQTCTVLLRIVASRLPWRVKNVG